MEHQILPSSDSSWLAWLIKCDIYLFIYFFGGVKVYCFTLKDLHQKHLQTQTFKVMAPNATNITFIVYKYNI